MSYVNFFDTHVIIFKYDDFKVEIDGMIPVSPTMIRSRLNNRLREKIDAMNGAMLIEGSRA